MSESSLSRPRAVVKRSSRKTAGRRERAPVVDKKAGEKRPGDKRPRILEAAVRVFAKNGFYATRVSDVARAAGVADGTIYLYFRSKDELLLSLFEDRVEKLLSYIREEVQSWSEPPRSSGASSSYSSGSSKASATWRKS